MSRRASDGVERLDDRQRPATTAGARDRGRASALVGSLSTHVAHRGDEQADESPFSRCSSSNGRHAIDGHVNKMSAERAFHLLVGLRLLEHMMMTQQIRPLPMQQSAGERPLLDGDSETTTMRIDAKSVATSF